MNEKSNDWRSIKWDTINKIVYRYIDRSVHPDYHRSYSITITNTEKTLIIYSYLSDMLSRSYVNKQESFDCFKEKLVRYGIFSHEEIKDHRTGITMEYIELYDSDGCVYEGYTTDIEGVYGNLYLPKEAAGLFRDEIPDSVGDLIHKTIEEVVHRKKEEEMRRRQEEEEKRQADIAMRLSNCYGIFESLSQDMMFVEGGLFCMGSDKEDACEDEKPIHKVELSPFYLCRYEVTQELWLAVMDSNPSNFKGDRRPVEQVSYEDCHRFIGKLNQLTRKNYRLPTEAEWEYAARGGNKSNGYKYAGSNNIDEVAWYSKTTDDEETHQVGQKQPNELGLYDMSGNVWEWCQDNYDCYDSSDQINPKGPEDGNTCVFRGGGYNSDSGDCRVSCRKHWWRLFRNANLGFRLAL